MTDTQALRDLLAKVDAGADHLTILELAGNWAYAHGHAGLYVYVIDAYNGSLDAAKALHDAVLPGFGWGKEALSSKPYVMEIEGQIIEFGEAETTARAWLIAILRALIAQAEQ